MQTVTINDYKISIQEAPDYHWYSCDSKDYDKILHLAGDEDFTRTILLTIRRACQEKKVVLVAPYYTIVDCCALPAGNRLFLMLNDLLCLFNLASLDIDKLQKLDTIGTMFAPYPYKKDLILYGELDIFRVASDLSIQWQFSGKDIFVNCNDDAPAFEMKSDRIYLRDFEGEHYEIDYDGKLIQTLKHEKRRWTGMGTRNFKVLEKPFKLFLMIYFLILVLSFIVTAQFANECYQGMSFAGFAALFAWFFSLVYCVLSVVVFVLLGIVLWRKNSILVAVAFLMQILIRLPSCLFRILDGYFPHSWHDIIIYVQIAMGIVGLACLFFRYIRTRAKLDDNIKN